MAGIFSVATFRTLGTAATPHTLFSLENTAGSAVSVRVRRLLVQMDATAVLTTFMPLIKTSRVSGALPSGGTTLAKSSFVTANASAANVVARGATASDGGVATAITATPGTVAWQQYGMRLHTAVGQVLAPDNNQLPALVETFTFSLVAGEALMVQIVAAAGTSNPATNYYFVACTWEEV
jgi:hypothetical protein